MTALLVLVGVSTAVPAGAKSPTARCISDNGTNVQRYFGLRGSDVIWPNIHGLSSPCLTVVKGNTFYRAHGWIAQLPSQTIYPDDYQPADPDPMTDFLSKLTESRYVISRDGQVEVERTVAGPELIDRAHLGRFGDLFVAPDTTLVPGATIEASSPEWTTLEPFSSRRLTPGDHTIQIYWTLTDRHCDGFAADPVNNCLPAGETLTTQTTFTVVERP